MQSAQPSPPASRADLLHPLGVTSYHFTYCYDHPLQCIANRYTCEQTSESSSAGKKSYTILLAGGISFNEPTYLPVIKELFRLSNHPSSRTHIHSIWNLERPDHGDSGVMNEKTLREHYRVMFRSLEYAQAIRTFLEKDFLSFTERKNLVGLGHSGGCGSIMQALELAGYTPKDKPPFFSFIFAELPLVSYDAQKFFMMLWKAIERSNLRRPSNWDSKQSAMNWMMTHFPWQTLHPDVLRIVEETYFRPDPVYPHRITTKTAIEQETMNYLSDMSHLSALSYLRTILHVIPTYVVLGSKKDIWPPPIYEMMEKNVQQDLASYAAVKMVPGVGHYYPLTHPAQFSAEIFSILNGSQTGVRSKM